MNSEDEKTTGGYRRSNLESAKLILAKAAAGDPALACLVAWARLIDRRHSLHRRQLGGRGGGPERSGCLSYRLGPACLGICDRPEAARAGRAA